MEGLKHNSILIVDDEKSNILALTHMLSPEYTLYAARDGNDAIDAAWEHRPDLILLDVLMPGLDGYAVYEALKNNDETKGIPVIFITGLSDAEDEQKCLSLGAADYISKPFSSAVVELRVRNQIKIVNQINIINRLSVTDQLTGIPNRRSFDEHMKTEWFRSARDKKQLSILLLDLDKFKVLNDTYGHLQGDVALKRVAEILMKILKRPADFFARWGGEEFVVLLPNTDIDGAMGVAEQIRETVGNIVIPLENDEAIRVTVSIGVSTRIPSQEDSSAEFINQADKALYRAKETGRNKVCNYDDIEAA